MISFIFKSLCLAGIALADWNITYAPFSPPSGKLSTTPTADMTAAQYSQFISQRGNVARLNFLANTSQDLFKFNFNPNIATTSASKGSGGLAVLADRNTMPGLYNRGAAMAMGFLEPCGVNAPHYHPYATQLVLVAQGGPLKAGAIWQNAATQEQLQTVVNTYEMVMLAQGSFHYVFNDNCERAVTVNAFSSDDPGILNLAQTFFKFTPDILNGTMDYPKQLNGVAVGDFKKQIPPSYVRGSEACLKRCGLSTSIVGTPPAATGT